MPEHSFAGGGPDLGEADFDRMYRGGPLVEGVQFDGVPWDIGEAQPCVAQFERAGRFRGHVLDIGCGLGENAIYLSSLGYQVTGLDAAAAAIEEARRRAEQRDAHVDFAVVDALDLSAYAGRFDSVLDSACYHCFDEDGRRTYTTALHQATRPQALLNVFCFADAEGTLPNALSVTEQNIRTTLEATGWRVTDLRQTWYVVADNAAAFAAKAGLDMGLSTDEQGRTRFPVWAVQAERA